MKLTNVLPKSTQLKLIKVNKKSSCVISTGTIDVGTAKRELIASFAIQLPARITLQIDLIVKTLKIVHIGTPDFANMD